MEHVEVDIFQLECIRILVGLRFFWLLRFLFIHEVCYDCLKIEPVVHT